MGYFCSVIFNCFLFVIIYILMFIEVFFIIVKKVEMFKCLLVVRWRNEICFIYLIEYYLILKEEWNFNVFCKVN